MRGLDGMAVVSFNGDFFEFTTMSNGGLRYGEPSVAPHYLAPDSDDSSLGQILRNALKASKQVSAEEFQKIFNSGIIQKRAKENEAWMMQKYGYKTQLALYKHMKYCSVNFSEGVIEISPSHSDKKGGYSRRVGDGIENIRLPDSVSDAELGAALRDGFKRCTGAVDLD